MSFGIEDGTSYFVARDGKTFGPYRGDALPAMYTASQLLPTDLIAEANGTEWITVAQAIARHNTIAAPPVLRVIAHSNASANGLGIASLILGIVSLLFTLSGAACVSVFIAPVGLLLGFMGLKHPERGLATAGIILNSITVILSILAALGAALCCGALAAAA